MRKMIVGLALLGIGLQGCYIDICGPVYPEPEEESTETIVIINEPVQTVDTHWPIPVAVEELLAPYVQGYFTPKDGRYSDYLYYQDTPRGYDNHPSYVRGDFNGDWGTDHALLFTCETRDACGWNLNTRLLVVLSTYGGYDLTVDMNLGSVSGECGYDVEEYWSICKMPTGVHVYEAVYDDAVVEEEIVLENDAFILTSLATGEKDLFYAVDCDVYYMPWEPASLAKRPARTGRTISPAPWKSTIQKRIIPAKKK
ncbi:MAG: hypothetical protein GF344_05480 [Chitinivibrionales bacterium]|nr:hypothetical protein [Chitinivibrionales bacterium]MBD3356422.1 hypothetical protein [Chitinivibrionales bacterium]